MVPAVLMTAGVLVVLLMVSTGTTTVKVADAATVLLTTVVPLSTESAPIGKVLT